jgi:hypothetical protein
MALTEDDEGLVRELRELLAENGAEWIAEQVDVDLASAQEAQIDPTIEAEALLVAISRSLGAIPEMLLDANETLSSPRQNAEGVLLGENEISFGGAEAELRLIVEAAAIIAAPVAHLLRDSTIDE